MEVKVIIREIKRISHLVDKDIAEILGVSKHSVSMWCNGRTEPRDYFSARLEEMLNELQGYECNVGKICCANKAKEILEDCKI